MSPDIVASLAALAVVQPSAAARTPGGVWSAHPPPGCGTAFTFVLSFNPSRIMWIDFYFPTL